MTVAPIVLAVAAAAFAAASLRLDGIAATVVAGYLALVTQLAAVTWVLSPFDAVMRPSWHRLATQVIPTLHTAL